MICIKLLQIVCTSYLLCSKLVLLLFHLYKKTLLLSKHWDMCSNKKKKTNESDMFIIKCYNGEK